MGSCHIVTRTTKAGRRYIVRYRNGGRGYALVHGGSFGRLDHARERQRLIGGWLALGLDPSQQIALQARVTGPTRLGLAAQDWLASRIDLAEQSRRIYGSYVSSLSKSALAERTPASLTPKDIRDEVARWIEDGLAPKSIRGHLSVLRQILDFADIEPNPARHRSVRTPAATDRDLVLPSTTEVMGIATGLAWKYRLPFVLLEQTGMRVGEVVSLERDDVDAGALRLRIKASNRKGKHGSRRPRFVPVPAWLMEVIATSLPLTGQLFPEVTADGIRSAMRDVCTTKGLTHRPPHQMRHRRISLWHFQGVPARELADRAGHAKPSMSLDVYSHTISVDEVDPEILKALITTPQEAQNPVAVMHG